MNQDQQLKCKTCTVLKNKSLDFYAGRRECKDCYKKSKNNQSQQSHVQQPQERIYSQVQHSQEQIQQPQEQIQYSYFQELYNKLIYEFEVIKIRNESFFNIVTNIENSSYEVDEQFEKLNKWNRDLKDRVISLEQKNSILEEKVKKLESDKIQFEEYIMQKVSDYVINKIN